MPKKSKKTTSRDSDLPDLETRREYLLSMGMASPYRGGSTSSSSSTDTTSSSSTPAESEKSDNNEASAVTAHGDASEGDMHGYNKKTSEVVVSDASEDVCQDVHEGEGNVKSETLETSEVESTSVCQVIPRDENVEKQEDLPNVTTLQSDSKPGSIEVKIEEIKTGQDSKSGSNEMKIEEIKNGQDSIPVSMQVENEETKNEQDSKPGIIEVKKEETKNEQESSFTAETSCSENVSRARTVSVIVKNVQYDTSFQNPCSSQMETSTIPGRRSEESSRISHKNEPRDPESVEDRSELPKGAVTTSPEGIKRQRTSRPKSPELSEENKTSVLKQLLELKSTGPEDEKVKKFYADYRARSSTKSRTKPERTDKSTEPPPKRTLRASSKGKDDKGAIPTEFAKQTSAEATMDMPGVPTKPETKDSESAKNRKRTRTSPTEIPSRTKPSSTRVSSKRRTKSVPISKTNTELPVKERKRTVPLRESALRANAEMERMRHAALEEPKEEKPKSRTSSKSTRDKTQKYGKGKTRTRSKTTPMERKRKSSETTLNGSPEKTEGKVPPKRAPKEAAVASVKTKSEISSSGNKTAAATPKMHVRSNVSTGRNRSRSWTDPRMPEASSIPRTVTTTTISMQEISPSGSRTRFVAPTKPMPVVSPNDSSMGRTERSLAAPTRRNSNETRVRCGHGSTICRGARPKTRTKNTSAVSPQEGNQKCEATLQRTPRRTSRERDRIQGRTRGFAEGHDATEERPAEYESDSLIRSNDRDRRELSSATPGRRYDYAAQGRFISCRDSLRFDHPLRFAGFDASDRAVRIDRLPNNSESLPNHRHSIQSLTNEEFSWKLRLEHDDGWLTIEEFRRGLGTDKIPPPAENWSDIFMKALEEYEAKKLRRVTFLIPGEPVPSTSQRRTSPEREGEAPRGSCINPGRCPCAMTFAEFYDILHSFPPLDFDPEPEPEPVPACFDMSSIARVIMEMETSELAVPENQVVEEEDSDSSNEGMNRVIAESGMTMKRSQVISSEDESIETSETAETAEQCPVKSLPCSGEFAEGTPKEQDLSELSGESPEEHVEKSPESDAVSSESLVKSSESEATPMSVEKSSESVVKSSESEATPESAEESSESAVKSAESDKSPEESTGIQEGSSASRTEPTLEASTSSEVKSSAREDSTGSSEECDTMSPEKRQRKDDDSEVSDDKPEGRQPRSRTQSESDFRKRRPSDKDTIPKKKRYSDEH